MKHKIESNIGGLYTSVTSRRCDGTRGTEFCKITYFQMFRSYTAKTSRIHSHFLYLFAELTFSVEWWSVTIIWSCENFKGTLLRQNSHFASPLCSSRHNFSSNMSLTYSCICFLTFLDNGTIYTLLLNNILLKQIVDF